MVMTGVGEHVGGRLGELIDVQETDTRIQEADGGGMSRDELLSLEYTEVLKSEDPRIRAAATRHLGIRRVPLLDHLMPTSGELAADPHAVPKPLRIMGHQTRMLRWVDHREKNVYMSIRGGIICADMGLMKTSTSIVHVLSQPRKRNPTLVVCSKTLMESWKADLDKFLGASWVAANVIFLHRDHLGVSGLDRVDRSTVRKAEIVVTAYPACTSAHKSLLERKQRSEECDYRGLDVLYGMQWTRVILDESQSIANPDTAVYSACCALVAECKLCLTGTPLMNKDDDVLSQLIFLGVSPVPARRTWDAKRCKDLGLDKVLLRMDYEDAGIVLPPRDDYFVTFTLSKEERELYDHVENRARDLYNQMEKNLVSYSCVLEAMLRLRQICDAAYLLTLSENYGKAKERLEEAGVDSRLCRWMTDRDGTAGLKSAKSTAIVKVLRGIPKERVVIFSKFSAYLGMLDELLEREGRPHMLLDGSVKTKERKAMVESFSTEDRPWVLLLNYQIGGVGLNLQAGNIVIFADYLWNNSGMRQAAMRVWRSGQLKSVYCYYMHIVGTVEERLLELCEEKSELAKTYEALGVDLPEEGGLLSREGNVTKDEARRLLGMAPRQR
jgi:SNF2 family DNA or RNA helicase